MTVDPGRPPPGNDPGRNRGWFACRGWLIPEARYGRSPSGAHRVVGSAAGLVILVGIADWLTGAQFSLLLFYLVPVGLVSWFAGVGPGFAMSAFAAVAWFVSRALYPEFPPDVLPYWNTLVRFGIFLVVAYVVSMQAALRRMLEREKELSRADPLTGVMNRRAFGEQATEEIVRSERYGRPFSLAYMDPDDFKNLNDRYGHGVGDRLLRAVADALRRGRPLFPAGVSGGATA